LEATVLSIYLPEEKRTLYVHSTYLFCLRPPFPWDLPS
jgi:hypothetical protein